MLHTHIFTTINQPLHQLSATIINLPDLVSRQQKMCEMLSESGKLTSASEAEDLIKANDTFYKKLRISNVYKPSGTLENTKVEIDVEYQIAFKLN